MKASGRRVVVNCGSGLFLLFKVDQSVVAYDPKGHLVCGLFHSWRGIGSHYLFFNISERLLFWSLRWGDLNCYRWMTVVERC